MTVSFFSFIGLLLIILSDERKVWRILRIIVIVPISVFTPSKKISD